MVLVEDGSSLLSMKDRMIDPSSAHGSCKSRGSVLSRLSLQSREQEYEEQQALSRSKHGASGRSLRLTSEASTAQFTGASSTGDEADCISQLMAESDIGSVQSSSQSNTRLSPLGIVVKKCSRELQADPPISERRAQLILQSLLNILTNHSMETTSNVLHNSAPTKNNLSAAENAKVVAIKYGALPAIVCVMKTYKDSIKIQSRAVSILGALGDENAEHQESIAECHGICFILAALLHSSHSKSGSFCLQACSSLVHVMSESQRSVSQLANTDGVRTIRKVMQNHSKQVGIQQYCLSVLGFVAKLPQPHETIDQCIRGSVTSEVSVYTPYKFLTHVEDPEVVEVIVETLLRHKKTKPILQMGGSLLFILSTQGSPRTKNALTWAKAVPVILKVMKSFFTNRKTQFECAMALKSLSLERPEARDTLAEDGCAILLESLGNHPTHLEVQGMLLELLSLLCEHDHTAAYLAKCLKKNPKLKNALLEMQSGNVNSTYVTKILVSTASK